MPLSEIPVTDADGDDLFAEPDVLYGVGAESYKHIKCVLVKDGSCMGAAVLAAAAARK